MRCNGQVRALAAALAAAACLGAGGCGPHQPAPQLAAQYVQAKTAYAAGDLAQAEQQLAAILARDRRFHQAAFLLGKVYFFQDRLDDARRTFDGLRRPRPGHHEAEIWSVRVMARQGRIEAAVRETERLLAFDPGDPRLLFLRGSLALEQQDLQAALELFDAAAGFAGELARARLESARIYHQFGLPARALRELDACRALSPPGSPVGDAAAGLAEQLRQEARTP